MSCVISAILPMFVFQMGITCYKHGCKIRANDLNFTESDIK